MLIKAIERLWVEVERLNRPIVGFRAPGISASEVELLFGALIPEDVVTWFNWSNGVEYHPGQIQDDAALVPGYEPLSLIEAKAVRDSYGIADTVLGRLYIPLLATGGGDFYAAVYEASLRPPRIAHVMIGGESKIAYDDLEGMVDSFCDFYRTGVFFVSDEGALEADDSRWVEVESEAGSDS
ncbi:hypothetical protein [Streptomyces sp. NPDC056045]|uniref:hypothetical protein n=1 Tax=Streptomyces sp. NPDC056045 TaxID=3345691 RepID=UPI0035D5A364